MEYLVCKLIEHISKNIAVLSVVDEDYGQLEALDNENVDMYPLTFPAVLIETPETEWGDIQTAGRKARALSASALSSTAMMTRTPRPALSPPSANGTSCATGCTHYCKASGRTGTVRSCEQNQSSSRGTTASRCTKRHTPLPYRKMSLWEKRPFSVRKSRSHAPR